MRVGVKAEDLKKVTKLTIRKARRKAEGASLRGMSTSSFSRNSRN